jgi:hypothetical protein
MKDLPKVFYGQTAPMRFDTRRLRSMVIENLLKAMSDETKPLTMQDLMEQNARLEKIVIGMASLLDDILETVDRETGQLWEYILPKK